MLERQRGGSLFPVLAPSNLSCRCLQTFSSPPLALSSYSGAQLKEPAGRGEPCSSMETPPSDSLPLGHWAELPAKHAPGSPASEEEEGSQSERGMRATEQRGAQLTLPLPTSHGAGAALP